MNLEEWIFKKNEQYRTLGMDQRRRPWEACSDYSKEFKVVVDFRSKIATNIFKWFENNSKPGTHKSGCIYESVYFYDLQFWIISVPVIYGAPLVDLSDFLIEIPNHIKDKIMNTPKYSWDYIFYCADCMDYGYGRDELCKTKNLNDYGIELFKAAVQEFKIVTTMLSQRRPNHRAILNCRLALEIFFKSYIALKKGLTEKQARKIGHNLNKGLDEFIKASGAIDWENTRHLLKIFPENNDRYKEQDISLQNLWDGYLYAQSLGTIIIREFTDRNTLQQIIDINRDKLQANHIKI